MNVLRECPALRIEDLVNIFPDFTTIDHLKACASCLLPLHALSQAATCGDGRDYTTYHVFLLVQDALSTSLGEYDRHIESLKEEMRQVQQSTETLRSDTRLLKNMCAQSEPHAMPSPVASHSHLVLQMLHSFAFRHLSVRSDCRCELCRKYVFSESNISEGSSSGQRASRGFFIYPCEHAFHVSCLYYVVGLSLILLQALFTLTTLLGTSSEII